MAHQMARAAINKGARVLSVLEKVKLVCWFEETHSFAQVARRYRAEFGMDPPQMDQVKKLHQRFLNTGSILNGTTTTTSQTMATAAFSAGIDDGVVNQSQQQMSVVCDAGALDAEEQLRMARM
ncbi:hypothetical protein niasHS_018210 [Heterodera schachtii]|uniref:DUF4817 domain-containing protein n=1 Tax=Heterodera schachtii TaxID=97005 RepID=A0ABD2HVM8_HETSC